MNYLKRDINRLISPGKMGIRVLKLILSYRLMPVILLRFTQCLRQNHIPLIPDILAMINFIFFGIEVAKQCKIGPGLILAHSQAVVIGASVIGKDVTIFSSVTIGAKGLGIPFRKEDRPSIGNNVVIGTGAKIIGGIKIGDNSVIGANSVVTKDVPADSVVMGIPAVIKKKNLEAENE